MVKIGIDDPGLKVNIDNLKIDIENVKSVDDSVIGTDYSGIKIDFDTVCDWVNDRMVYGRYKPSHSNPFQYDECCLAGDLAIRALRVCERLLQVSEELSRDSQTEPVRDFSMLIHKFVFDSLCGRK